MGLFKKKADPITERSRALKQEIAALEAQIRQLSEEREDEHAKIAAPGTSTRAVLGRTVPTETVKPRVLKRIPAAEFKLEADPVLAPDLETPRPGLLKRLSEGIRGRPTTNPKLVHFLAAGSIQGLRPLRYEKRVARNRLIFLCGLLLLLIWGILAVVLRH